MSAQIIILEGFEMVGKTSFFKKSADVGSLSLYVPSHDLTDKTIGRNNSWVIGWSVIDFLSKIQSSLKSTIVIDRGIFSSIVYEKLYHNRLLDREILRQYKSCKFFKDRVKVMYFYHRNKSSAREIFERARSRNKNENELSAQYDSFISFDDYWRSYRKFHFAYLLSFALMGVNPIFVETDVDCYRFRGPGNHTKRLSLGECLNENWTLC